MQNQNTLSRRQLLARIAALTGVAISAPLASAVLADAKATGALSTLSARELELVTAIIDVIIPETDTPSASAAEVQHFIHMMLSDWYSVTERKQILTGLQTIEEQAHAQTGKRFAEASPAEQLSVLQVFDQAAYGGTEKDHFFKKIKEMTTVGYYTSEIGATEELLYEPVPGPFRGCVPFSEIGRTWAL